MPPLSPNQRWSARILLGFLGILSLRTLFSSSPKPDPRNAQIVHSGILERISTGVSLRGQALDPRVYPFLQSRINRDEKPDLFDASIRAGMNNFWDKFQVPFATNPETIHLDEQVVKGVVEELMSFNGWASAACSSLARPFSQSQKDDSYRDLTKNGQLYFFGMIVHSADHFLLDQLATIIQLAKKLGPQKIYVSMLDYGSVDSVPFLSDLAETMFTLLGISFRIHRVEPLTSDPTASYYPLEESHTRNLVIEPLMELYHRRKVRFTKVIWLKGFTCANDILETLRVSAVNKAAMVCAMDWKEHNGFFIFNDRWRTRDVSGNLFRGSKSTSPSDEAPPRDELGTTRYLKHLPVQVFCCESGTHIVDPAQAYYAGLSYRSSIDHGIFNISSAEDGKAPKWSEGPCMDSSQMHFCRDLWMVAAREGVKAEARAAKERERKGQPKDVSDDMERVFRAVVPNYGTDLEEEVSFRGFGKHRTADDDDEEEEDDDEKQKDSWDSSAGLAMGDLPDPEDEPIAKPKAEQDAEAGVVAAADAAAAALPIDQQHPAGAGDIDKVVVPPTVVTDDDEEADDGGVDAGSKKEAKPKKVLVKNPPKHHDEDGEQPAGAGAGAAADPKKKVDGKKKVIKIAPGKPKLEDDENIVGKPIPGEAKAVEDPKAEAKVEGAKVEGAKVEEDKKEAEVKPVEAEKPAEAEAKPVDAKVERRAIQESILKRFKDYTPSKIRARFASYDNLDTAESSEPPKKKSKKRANAAAAGRTIPNQAFEPARIMSNPRCVTTYAGVSHTQLAMDLFGGADDDDISNYEEKYKLDIWSPAPETFVCQEMRTTGGRGAPKQQRRTGFYISRALVQGWIPR